MVTPLADLNAINYPDVLGYVTGGERLNINVVQCALTTRPEKINAGQNFEVLFLVQNASDIDIDVTVDLKLPERDLQKRRGMFFSKSSRLLLGLRPAEAGLVTLPASCSPKTEIGAGYSLAADIKVERVDKARKPLRIRQVDGGGEVLLDILSEEIRETLRQLRQQTWETEGSGIRGNHVLATFEVLPQGLASLREFKAGWQSLWTMDDYLDENLLKERVQPSLDKLLPIYQNNRAETLQALQQGTQQWFTKAGYALRDIESLTIAKLLTVVLLDAYADPTATRQAVQPKLPTWEKKLIQILHQEPRLTERPKPVLIEQVYPSLVEDAVMYAFKMVKTVLDEDFGANDERHAYALEIREALEDAQVLSYGQVYLPLMIGGIIACNRATLENENVRDTLFSVIEAHDARQPEINNDNQFVADMVKTTIDRSLDSYRL